MDGGNEGKHDPNSKTWNVRLYIAVMTCVFGEFTCVRPYRTPMKRTFVLSLLRCYMAKSTHRRSFFWLHACAACGTAVGFFRQRRRATPSRILYALQPSLGRQEDQFLPTRFSSNSWHSLCSRLRRPSMSAKAKTSSTRRASLPPYDAFTVSLTQLFALRSFWTISLISINAFLRTSWAGRAPKLARTRGTTSPSARPSLGSTLRLRSAPSSPASESWMMARRTAFLSPLSRPRTYAISASLSLLSNVDVHALSC
jgi:hypothetical protein